MIIGVGAVITMVALGRGAQATIEEQVKSAGTNVININAGNFTQGGVRQGQGMSSSLTAEDATALRSVQGIQYVSAGVNSRGQIIAGNQNWSSQVQGVDVDLQQIRSWPTNTAASSPRRTSPVRRRLPSWARSSPKRFSGPTSIRPARSSASVTSPSKSSASCRRKARARSDRIRTTRSSRPTRRSRRSSRVRQHINNITVVVRNRLIRRRSRLRSPKRSGSATSSSPAIPDDFTVRTQEEIASLRTETTRTMTVLLAAIAGVSLVVGGIGIMNIMLVSVTERTREIGLRMAIGARGSDVLLQFLVEAIVISLFGGLIGIALGFALSMGIERFASWPTSIPADWIGVAFGVRGRHRRILRVLPGAKGCAARPDRGSEVRVSAQLSVELGQDKR